MNGHVLTDLLFFAMSAIFFLDGQERDRRHWPILGMLVTAVAAGLEWNY